MRVAEQRSCASQWAGPRTSQRPVMRHGASRQQHLMGDVQVWCNGVQGGGAHVTTPGAWGDRGSALGTRLILRMWEAGCARRDVGEEARKEHAGRMRARGWQGRCLRTTRRERLGASLAALGCARLDELRWTARRTRPLPLNAIRHLHPPSAIPATPPPWRCSVAATSPRPPLAIPPPALPRHPRPPRHPRHPRQRLSSACLVRRAPLRPAPRSSAPKCRRH